MRIAVLLTNDDQSEFRQAFPDDAQVVINALSRYRPEWQYQAYRAVDRQLPDNGTFDAFVITGSPASVNDSDNWVAELMAFIQKANSAQQRGIGLCFGHQAIARALGGRVGRPTTQTNSGWGLGYATTLYRQTLPWMSPQQNSLRLLAAHKEQVLEAPASARILGGNEFCPNAAMTVGTHFMSTQYHPEMSPEFLHALLIELGQKLPASVIQNARQQLESQSNDDAIFLHWMINFIEAA